MLDNTLKLLVINYVIGFLDNTLHVHVCGLTYVTMPLLYSSTVIAESSCGSLVHIYMQQTDSQSHYVPAVISKVPWLTLAGAIGTGSMTGTQVETVVSLQANQNG